MIKNILKIFMISLAISSCVPPNLNLPTVVVPSNGATYIGTYGSPSPLNNGTVLPEKIILNYSSNPGSASIYLNSAVVSNKFTFGPTSATAKFSDVAEFLRQGPNTLLVNPQSFGPSVTFNLDSSGPIVIVDKVICNDGNCRDVNGGTVTVEVTAVDPSSITEMSLSSNDYIWNGGTDNSQYTPFKTGKVVDGVVYPMSSLGSSKYRATIPESKLYSFTAKDANGYVAKTEYLSEGQKINSVFKMRIGKTLLDSMMPVIEPYIEEMHIYSPSAMADYGKTPPTGAVASDTLDNMAKWWTSDLIFYGDTGNGASTSNPADCGHVDTNVDLTSSNFYCSVAVKTDKKNGKKYCPTGNVDLNGTRTDAKEGRCSAIVMFRLQLDQVDNMTFTLSDAVNGRLVLDMQMKDGPDAGNSALNTDLAIRNIKCDHRYTTASYCTNYSIGICWSSETGVAYPFDAAKTHAPKDYCRDDGDVKALGLISLGDLKVSATAGNPKGNIDARLLDGAMLLNIDKNTFKLNLSGLNIGSGLDFFISILSGLLDGMFVDIVSGVIKQNMTDFILGADITTDNGGKMRLQSQAYQVFTNADNNAATPVEWYMYYTGFLSPIVPDPDVPPLLGSYFKRSDLVRPADNPASAIDNFSIGINSNIINQGLASIYRSGIMHFTFANFKKDGKTTIHYGPKATDSETGLVKGDMRIVFIPNSPAQFEMIQGGSGTQATLEYQGAEMDVQDYTATGTWHTIFHAKVDIKAGVLLSVVNQQVRMTIQGTPQLTIRELLDFTFSASGNNGSVNISISKKVFETAINEFLKFIIPQVAESYLNISVPDITTTIPGKTVITTTEGIEANNGAHLGFSMGLNLQ